LFLVVLAVGARSIDRNRSRILRDAFVQAALAAENLRLRDDARAADKAKTDLLSILSHELRAPLGIIRLLVEMVLDVGVADEAELRATLRRVSHQVNRAADLIQTMLEFGSIQSGRLNLAVEEFDVAELLDYIRAELPATWRRADVPVLWALPAK